jgi:hypothetical protein
MLGWITSTRSSAVSITSTTADSALPGAVRTRTVPVAVAGSNREGYEPLAGRPGSKDRPRR